jgi:hypothetical protein
VYLSIGKGPQSVGRRQFAFFAAQRKGRTMLRRNLAGIIVLALLSTAAFAAQIKEMPRTPIKPINAPKAVDINTGTANDFVNLGIDASTAKKIVDGRPYRSKRDLVTRQILTNSMTSSKPCSSHAPRRFEKEGLSYVRAYGHRRGQQRRTGAGIRASTPPKSCPGWNTNPVSPPRA